MKFRTVRLAAALAFCAVWSASAASQTDVRRGGPSGPPAELRATLDKYCASCHNARVKTSATAVGVVLNDADLTAVATDPVLWEKVVRKLRTGAMPPAGMPRPDAEARRLRTPFARPAFETSATNPISRMVSSI